jgi:hypothetical protein
MHDAYDTTGACALMEPDAAAEAAPTPQAEHTPAAPPAYVWTLYPEFFRKAGRRYRLPVS